MKVSINGSPVHAPWTSLEAVDSLQAVWVQPLDHHSLLLRLAETSGQSGDFTLLLRDGWEASPCHFDGSPLTHSNPNPSAPLSHGPYSLRSLKLRQTVN